MTKFSYGWGQTESLINGLAQQISFYTRDPSTMGFTKHFDNQLQFWKNGHSHNYSGEDQLEAWRKASEKHKDLVFVKKIFKESKDIRRRYYLAIKAIEKTDFNNINKKRLLKLFKSYYKSIREIRGIFTISAPNGTFYVEQEIKKILSALKNTFSFIFLRCKNCNKLAKVASIKDIFPRVGIIRI